MTEYHITFVRDADRVRLIFVLPAADLDGNFEAAFQAVMSRAPRGFRLVACHPHDGGRIDQIPMDGDDYGRDAPSIPATWSPAPRA